MSLTSKRLAGLTVIAMAASAPCLADSLASSASSAGSASVGSLSTSFKGSSDGSSPKTAAADGDYRVTAVTELADRPGMLQLAMQPHSGEAGTVWLTLPQRALGQRALAAGDIVSAQRRPYGVEFTRSAALDNGREAFFLLLSDDWLGDLDPRAVTL